MEHNQINVQQDKLEKLRAAQKDFEKAQAKAWEWTKVYQLTLASNRDDLISRAEYKKQRCEEIACRLKNIIDEQTSQLNTINRDFSYSLNQVSQTRKNIVTGAAFISVGAITGANLSSTIGGMGLVGSFGGIGIGAAPVICAGAVTGAAAYGTLQVIQGDKAAMSAIAIGSIGGATASSFVGNYGISRAKNRIGSWYWYITYGSCCWSCWACCLWCCENVERNSNK